MTINSISLSELILSVSNGLIENYLRSKGNLKYVS